jgi:hypothetical protein
MDSLWAVAHDDWRVSATFEEEGGGLHLFRKLPEVQVVGDVRDRLGDRLSVSREGHTVFVYADAEGPAREAERILRDEVAESGHEAVIEVSRWHPVERRWEDPSVAVPTSGEALEAEEDIREEDDAADSVRQGGAPQWEVRLELTDEDAAAALAERLDGEGVPVTRHHRYLLAGAVNQEDAEALAARLQEEAPKGSQVQVEPGGLMAWEARPSNPFAIFGGLGG